MKAGGYAMLMAIGLGIGEIVLLTVASLGMVSVGLIVAFLAVGRVRSSRRDKCPECENPLQSRAANCSFCGAQAKATA